MDFFKKQRLLIVAIIVLVILNILTIGSVWLNQQPGKREFREERPPRGSVFEKRLGLSEDQKMKFMELREAHFEEMKPIMDQLKTANRELLEMMKEDVDNDSILDVKAEEIAGYHKKIEISRYRHFLTLRSECSPEQKEEFDKIVSKISERGYGPRRKRMKRRR